MLDRSSRIQKRKFLKVLATPYKALAFGGLCVETVELNIEKRRGVIIH